jgi:hypothetical protein
MVRAWHFWAVLAVGILLTFGPLLFLLRINLTNWGLAPETTSLQFKMPNDCTYRAVQISTQASHKIIGQPSALTVRETNCRDLGIDTHSDLLARSALYATPERITAYELTRQSQGARHNLKFPNLPPDQWCAIILTLQDAFRRHT